VAEAVRNRNDVRRRLAEAAETLGTQHPKVRQLETELSQLTATLDQVRSVAAATLTREYEAARTTEVSMERELSSARGEVRSVNREEFQLAVLEREVQTNRELYNMFMSRAKETNLASDVQAGVARIADPAVPASIPFKPNRTQLVVVAAVLALFMGAMASLLLDRLDNTVKGGEDAEVRLHQPLLAALPAVAQLDRKGMARLFLEDGDSHFAEAIRTARTGVMLSSLDTPHKILLITSSLPGEGKTTVAVNMALAHAQTKRTLLIDCDMRRSQVSRSLGVLPNSKGLTNLVQGSELPQDCMSLVPGSKLMVMPVGDMPPNPLELLLSQRFKDTLKLLSEDFEMVIIDSPPVELVSEALVLAPLATSTAFVVKAMSTPAPLVRKSLARLQRAGANIVGVVVNQLNFKDASAYYGEYGHYGYSYGGYSNKPSLEDDSKPTVTRVDGAKPA
jgi:succinoglycan biosynthesis transport protein ExoP